MKNGLILDTSTSYLAIGIEKNGKIVSKKQDEVLRKQSELIMPYIESMMGECGLKAKDLDYVPVSTGPGSYTGVRIAMCVAKMLAVSLNIDLYSISTLKSYLGKNRDGLVLIDARSQSVFAYGVKDGRTVLEEQLIKLEDLDIKDYQDIINDAQLVGKEKNTIDIIERMMEIRDMWKFEENPHLLVPTYLKD